MFMKAFFMLDSYRIKTLIKSLAFRRPISILFIDFFTSALPRSHPFSSHLQHL